ncbi:MAG: CapA family protein [Prevotella sp.]|nr:CapA family protein [Prevotella sp.]
MRVFSIVLAVSLSALVQAQKVRQSTIVFTGDILLDRGVRMAITRHGADHLFSGAVDSVFRAANVVVGNLECPATKVKAPVQKLYIFRGEPEWLSVLRRHGFTHLNLANNHSIDQGREGLMDTRRNILKAGMTPVGADSTMAAAARPVLLTDKPRNVWLVASLRLALENFAYLENRPCVSQESMDALVARVRRLKQADPSAVVIVSLHWGGEHTLRPVPSQRLDAHRLIQAGADALVCHHTHTLQSVEYYHGKPVYYSIGNFIFDQQKPINSTAAMVQLTITADTVVAKTIPVDIRRCVPYIKN